MADQAKAVETMIRNIEAKAGMKMAQIAEVIAQSKLTKHGERRSMLMEKFGLGYGQANTAVHVALKSDGQSRAKAEGASDEELLAQIYSGKKEHLRPVHDRIMTELEALGEFEIAPKKTYFSYRRKKQFAMVGPKTNSQVEVGLAAKDLPAHPRLKEMPAGSMCRYTTRLSSPEDVDSDLLGWLRASFAEAG